MVSCGSEVNVMKMHVVNQAALGIKEIRGEQEDLRPDQADRQLGDAGGQRKLVTISKRLAQPSKGGERRKEEDRGQMDQSFEDEMNRRAHRMVKEQLNQLQALPEIM